VVPRSALLAIFNPPQSWGYEWTPRMLFSRAGRQWEFAPDEVVALHHLRVSRR